MWMGHFYYCEGWESPFSSIQVLTLVLDESCTLSLRQTVPAATGQSAGFQSGSGGVLRKVLRGVSRDNGRDSVLREPQ